MDRIHPRPAPAAAGSTRPRPSLSLTTLLVLSAVIVCAAHVAAAWEVGGGAQECPRLTSDGAGGAIVTWYDERSTMVGVYAQRVDRDGVARWAPDGVAL